MMRNIKTVATVLLVFLAALALGPHESSGDVDAWLDGSAGKEILVPAAEDMLNKVPVSQQVNSSRAPNDDPTLIESIRLEAA